MVANLIIILQISNYDHWSPSKGWEETGLELDNIFQESVCSRKVTGGKPWLYKHRVW